VSIRKNINKILSELPDGVKLVAAAKQRFPEEVLEAVECGVKIVGENYVGEAKRAYQVVGNKAEWHFIGRARTEKHDLLRRKTLEMFDMIETVDSVELAQEIDERCRQIGKVMPILIEINSGEEKQKAGVSPRDAEQLIKEVSSFKNIKVMGLMTMGPRFGNPEDARPYFIKTRGIFDTIRRLNLPNVDMRYLSMGMTNSYQVAVEEGANMVRIGTRLFGERDYMKDR